MGDYKHYIKTKVVGTDTFVLEGYADWETDKYNPADIQLSGTFLRQCQIQPTNARGQYLYKVVSGAMTARTQSELDAELAARKPELPSGESRLAAAESAILTLMGL